jgi:hypothetical protein
VQLTATIGPMEFVLVRATRAHLPRFAARPLPLPGGQPLAVAEEGSRLFLVLDYRRDPVSPAAARVELWWPCSPGEGPLDALLVIADAMGGAGARRFQDLSELADALAAADAGPRSVP